MVATATAGVAAHETGTASGLLNNSRQMGAELLLAAALIALTVLRHAGAAAPVEHAHQQSQRRGSRAHGERRATCR